jgi:hypothetical protein
MKRGTGRLSTGDGLTDPDHAAVFDNDLFDDRQTQT